MSESAAHDVPVAFDVVPADVAEPVIADAHRAIEELERRLADALRQADDAEAEAATVADDPDVGVVARLHRLAAGVRADAEADAEAVRNRARR